MPQPNDHLGPYILIQKLGSGQFGVVWKAQRRHGIAPPCAIKLPTDSEVKWEDIEKEARVWLQASGHPNVLPMIEANVYGEQIALVSEYAADGSLLDWLRKHCGKAPSVEKAVEMMSSILAGLEHLHRRNIIHRDLKPANILLQGDIPRLADFGLSRVLSSTQSTTPAGTLTYMSPEAFNGERNAQTDIWAAGVILYQLLTGRLPFPQRDMASLMNAIFMKPPDPLPLDLPEPVRSTVMRALEKTCERRYESAGAMRQALLKSDIKPQPQPFVPVPPRVNPKPYAKQRSIKERLEARHKRHNEIIGFCCIGIGLVLLFALLSYDSRDPSWGSATARTGVSNWIGPLGANTAFLLYHAFGYIALVIPAVFFVLAYWLIRYARIQFSWPKLMGLWVVLLSLTGLLAVVDSSKQASFHWGGVLGQWLVYSDILRTGIN